jgi:hypothetical protein
MSKRNNIVYIYILIHQTVCVVLLKYFENKNYERTRERSTLSYERVQKNYEK